MNSSTTHQETMQSEAAPVLELQREIELERRERESFKKAMGYKDPRSSTEEELDKQTLTKSKTMAKTHKEKVQERMREEESKEDGEQKSKPDDKKSSWLDQATLEKTKTVVQIAGAVITTAVGVTMDILTA